MKVYIYIAGMIDKPIQSLFIKITLYIPLLFGRYKNVEHLILRREFISL